MRPTKNACSAQRAAAVIEAAIVLPLLCIMIFGLVEIGGAINQYLRVSRLSYEIARISAGTDSGEFGGFSASPAPVINAAFIPQTEFQTKVHGLVALAEGLEITAVKISLEREAVSAEVPCDVANQLPTGCQTYVAVVVSQTYRGILNAGGAFGLVIPRIAVTVNAPFLFIGR